MGEVRVMNIQIIQSIVSLMMTLTSILMVAFICFNAKSDPVTLILSWGSEGKAVVGFVCAVVGFGVSSIGSSQLSVKNPFDI
jgi:hypothetical protein